MVNFSPGLSVLGPPMPPRGDLEPQMPACSSIVAAPRSLERCVTRVLEDEMHEHVLTEEVVGAVEFERYHRPLRHGLRGVASPHRLVASVNRERTRDQSQGKQAENHEQSHACSETPG
ncbi:MAG: hypothetical protein ACYSU3_14260 [Planctomycetota bacterium]